MVQRDKAAGASHRFPASIDAEKDFSRMRLHKDTVLKTMHGVLINQGGCCTWVCENKPSQSAKHPHVSTSLCRGVVQFVCYVAGWAGKTRDCLHKDDIATQALHCPFFFPLSPNRTNPEMNPNPVSRWLDPWKGSRKCLMVNKQYILMILCVLAHVFHFGCE